MQRSDLAYGRTGGSSLRNKSGERERINHGQSHGPIDIFIDVDSQNDPNVLMKSPSNTSMVGRGATMPEQTTSPSRPMNNLEARIRQRQTTLAKGVNDDKGGQHVSPGKTMSMSDQTSVVGQTKKQAPSQLQRLTEKIGGLDDRLSDGKSFTDTKFNQLNEQMNVIQEFIDEDREFRDQLRCIRRDEIKQLEDIVDGRF